MEIPFERLAPEILRSIIEEFVLREGTDYGDENFSLEAKVEQVLAQLARGEAIVVFDAESESCNIIHSKRKRESNS